MDSLLRVKEEVMKLIIIEQKITQKMMVEIQIITNIAQLDQHLRIKSKRLMKRKYPSKKIFKLVKVLHIPDK